MKLSPILEVLSIGWVGAVILVGLLINGDRLYPWIWQKVLNERDAMAEKLDLMFYEITAEKLLKYYTCYCGGLFALGALAVWPSVGFGALLGTIFVLVFWKMPGKVITGMQRRRTTKFVYQMVDGLSLMSNAMRSGLNVPQALQLVSDELPNPISQEFMLVLSQNKLGISLEDALSNLAVRMRHDDIEMFTTAVNILKETGGNLAETFESISSTIRERIKVESKIAAMTAQGVMQGVVVVIMPFALGGVLYAIDPVKMTPMFTTIPGWIMLMLMMTLQAVGAFAIWKIVQIRV